MMTQPIQMFENLTSETSPAGGNDVAKTTLSFEDRRMLEMRARYARAELVANGLADALLWLGRQYSRFVGAIKTDFKLKNLVGRGSGETIQMAFSGQGWVLVQPSEGRVNGSAEQGQRSGGLGGLLNQ